MTDTAGQKIKAYEAFTKLKNEKVKDIIKKNIYMRQIGKKEIE